MVRKFTEMKKIIVVGCLGSGKSTFSLKLHEKTGIPLCHLDNIWWRSDRTHIPREEFDQKLDEIMSHDSWIIDGDYSRTYEKRIAACDTIFFLDFAEDICMKGIAERVGKERIDMPWTADELDPVLVALVTGYEKENKPVLRELFSKYPDKNVVTFHTRAEAESWLEEINDNGRNETNN
jgi:adenylate kinase family enzyme